MIAILLALGCTTYTESHCEIEPREVADDERLDLGFTVTEALFRFDPDTIDAIDLFGDVVTIDVSLERGEGAATLEDATIVEEVVKQGGRRTSNEWVSDSDICQDVVSIPVRLTLAGEGVAVAGEATFSNDPLAFEFETFLVEYPVDMGADTLPEGLHGPLVGGVVSLSYVEGELAHLEAVAVTEDGARETVLWYQVR